MDDDELEALILFGVDSNGAMFYLVYQLQVMVNSNSYISSCLDKSVSKNC